MSAPGERIVAQGRLYLGNGVTRTWSQWSGGRHEWTWEDTRDEYLPDHIGRTYGNVTHVGSGVGAPPSSVAVVDVGPIVVLFGREAPTTDPDAQQQESRMDRR